MAVWSEEFETGIEAIDAQHKQLFEAINHLGDCFRTGQSEAAARKSLAFLHEYTLEHFDTEEEFMRVVGYPTLTSHRIEHSVLLTKVQNLILKMDEGFLISADVATFAADWLAHHINESDMGYVKFVREKLSHFQ
jgi:hemerythrin